MAAARFSERVQHKANRSEALINRSNSLAPSSRTLVSNMIIHCLEGSSAEISENDRE
jgi:hypothetical protein